MSIDTQYDTERLPLPDGMSEHPSLLDHVELGEQVLWETAQPDKANEEPPKKKSRKVKPETWKQNKRKTQRETGDVFVGIKNKEKALKIARSLKPRCNCKRTSAHQYADITSEQREEIFNNIWKKQNWTTRKLYVYNLVDDVPVERSRVNSDHSRRKTTLRYHLKHNGSLKPVCKTMFIATTSLGSWSIQQWAKGAQVQDNPRPAPQSKYYTRAADDREFMRVEFLEKLSKMPSHYCRASTGKLYLERTVPTYADLYRMYSKKCTEHNKRVLSRMFLMDEFHKMNLALFSPRKDQYDICVEHEHKNVSDDVWAEHIEKKNQAREAKQKDKDHAIQCLAEGYTGKKTLVTTMDVQAVLLAPCLQASALYYKQKLSVHNFTIYNLANQETECYIWHEGEGGLQHMSLLHVCPTTLRNAFNTMITFCTLTDADIRTETVYFQMHYQGLLKLTRKQ